MLELNFQPFPELNTERLLLRRLAMKDAPEIFFLRSDENVIRYTGREPAVTMREAEEFIEKINKGIDNNEHIMWAIALKENPDKLIGTISIWQIKKEHYRAEAGYVLHPDFWRKGIIKETLMKIIEYGFETMKLHSLCAEVASENIASCKVLESAGFVKEAYFKEDFIFRGKFYDSVIYSKLNNK